MLTVDEAFRKFKRRLELNDREQKNASQRQTEVREYLDTKFAIERSFLSRVSTGGTRKQKLTQGYRHLFRAGPIRTALSI